MALTADAFLERHSHAITADGEIAFVKRVLPKVKGLRLERVRPQTPFKDRNGGPRQIDFTIEEGRVRIAIEVDGLKKRHGEPNPYPDWEDWFCREQDLILDGWTLVRFANVQIYKDAGGCARVLSSVLDVERKLAKMMEGAERETADLRRRLKQLEQQASAAEAEREALGRQLTAERAQIRALEQDLLDASSDASEAKRLRQELAVAQTHVVELERQAAGSDAGLDKLAVEIERAREEGQRQTSSEEELAELDALNRERERHVADLEAELGRSKAAQAAAEESASSARKEGELMKTVIAACAAIVVAVVVGAIALAGGDDPGGDSTPTVAEATATAEQASPEPQASPETTVAPDDECSIAADFSEAGASIGSTGTFKGRVVSATYRPRNNGEPTFINVGLPFPDPGRLTIVVWGRNRSKFPTPPEKAYDGETVAITGVVTEFEGSPQIEARTPSEIEACG